MKYLLILIFVASCATFKKAEEAPLWVDGIRSGKESLKVINSNKQLYRRIAGSSEKSREKSCERAIEAAEADIKKEYPLFQSIPYSLEVLFYDENYNDCAVTISVSTSLTTRYEELKRLTDNFEEKQSELESKVETARSERAELESKYNQLQAYLSKNAHLLNRVNVMNSQIEEIYRLVQDNTSKAKKFAITGLSRVDFARYMELNRGYFAPSIDVSGPCYRRLSLTSVSQHGLIAVCWNNDHIVAYCDLVENQCYNRLPR